MADDVDSLEGLHVEETAAEQCEDEESFYDLDGVVVDDVTHRDDDERDLAEEEDVVYKSNAGLLEDVGLRSEIVTNEIGPQSFHPGWLWEKNGPCPPTKAGRKGIAFYDC